MPRTLVFQYGGVELGLVPEKLDRSKLYGSVEVEALDDQGRRCRLMTLHTDGKTLIGSGGTAIAYLTPEKRWIDRARLQPRSVDGDPLEPVPSSFDAPIPLTTRTTVDDYLSHNIKSVYAMNGDDPRLAELAAELREGAIYRFDYSFRGGIVPDVGFLLAGADDGVFLAVGQPTHLHFLGLDVAPAYEEDGEPGRDDDEELDFGML